MTTGDPSRRGRPWSTPASTSRHPTSRRTRGATRARRANGADDDGDGLVDDRRRAGASGAATATSPTRAGTARTSPACSARAAATGSASAGVCWSCTILPVDVYREGGRGTLLDLARGMAYAAERARIVNLSLESPVSSEARSPPPSREHPDRLFVVSAGNSGHDVDATPVVPVRVSGAEPALRRRRRRRRGRRGRRTGARAPCISPRPGVALVSTAPGGGTSAMTGSSFAAPLVSGTAALLWSWRPDATVEQVRAAILAGADRLPGWAGRTDHRRPAERVRRAARARGGARRGAPPPPRRGARRSATSASSSVRRAARAARRAVARAACAAASLTVRLLCRSRSQPCSGTRPRRAGARGSFAIAPGGRPRRAVPRASRRGACVVAVAAGERSRGACTASARGYRPGGWRTV